MCNGYLFFLKGFNMWILILTLSGGTIGSGVSITNIPNFVSMNDCNNAGLVWMESLNNLARIDPHYTCILQKQGKVK